MTIKLAIDMGSTSLGWCLLRLDKDNEPCGIIDLGIRIFPDGREDKSKEPLSVTRRNARGERRTRDRRKRRKTDLMKTLIGAGLMPTDEKQRKDLEKVDPYQCRARAVSEKISLNELGRALFHINQRRGFKSNRKTDARENKLSNMKLAMRVAIQDIASSLGMFFEGQAEKLELPLPQPPLWNNQQ